MMVKVLGPYTKTTNFYKASYLLFCRNIGTKTVLSNLLDKPTDHWMLFFWKIFSQLKIKEPIGLICSICLVFSASNFMYSYTDDHIAPWFVWSMVPLIIFKINDLYINPVKEIYDVRIFYTR